MAQMKQVLQPDLGCNAGEMHALFLGGVSGGER
jgi:hypothetical protein